ncbi:hypothetical protein DYQ86_09470 [Acidobacteria bacterium AB60]|nr:hypothetical protein DYQ86_09470 [Acidobacteria bacterium AB60]
MQCLEGEQGIVFTVDGVRAFHGWTHACIDVVLDHLGLIPESAYGSVVPGFGFGTLREQVVHLLNCEGLWVHLLRGAVYVDRRPEECVSVADARAMQRRVRGETEAYLEALTDEALNADAELRFPDGDVAVRTPAKVLHHVLTHAFHHKGQIVAMCRVLGYPAPDTDLSQID